MRILIIEDEKDLAEAIRDGLRTYYSVDVANEGQKGVNMVQYNDYDLIILDLGLPDMNGMDVCGKIRRGQVKTPILILTGEKEMERKVEALDLGADDYLTKPFGYSELEARVRALLRRPYFSLVPNEITVGDVTLNAVARTVTRAGDPIVLRRKEFDLLEYFMRNPNRVLTRDKILEHVWDESIDPFTNAIDVHVKYLRDQIDKPYAKKMIKTIHGLGYKLEP